MAAPEGCLYMMIIDGKMKYKLYIVCTIVFEYSTRYSSLYSVLTPYISGVPALAQLDLLNPSDRRINFNIFYY